MKYKEGDIVLASKCTCTNGEPGDKQLFIVAAVNGDNVEVISQEYLSFMVSSLQQRGNGVSQYRFNELLNKNETNNLKDDSAVECDGVYCISEADIVRKIGEVTKHEYGQRNRRDNRTCSRRLMRKQQVN